MRAAVGDMAAATGRRGNRKLTTTDVIAVPERDGLPASSAALRELLTCD